MNGSDDMNRNRAVNLALYVYIVLAYAFVFAPIAASFVFSFNSDRFPSIPLGEFSLDWYRAVASDPLVWEGARNTLVVGVIVGVISTALGFGARWLAPVLARPQAWRVLDALVAAVMFVLALSLAAAPVMRLAGG